SKCSNCFPTKHSGCSVRRASLKRYGQATRIGRQRGRFLRERLVVQRGRNSLFGRVAARTKGERRAENSVVVIIATAARITRPRRRSSAWREYERHWREFGRPRV